VSTDRVDFTRGAAERIARVVRIVETGERDQAALTFKRPVTEGGGGGKVRLGKTVAAWEKDSAQSIEIWDEGDPLNEEISSPLTTVTAYNRMYDVAACVWVLIAKESHGWYLVEAATPEESETGCAAPNISGHDLTTITGYASNKKQALTHDENACLKWVDIEDCA
jgi:hypothetical protein